MRNELYNGNIIVSNAFNEELMQPMQPSEILEAIRDQLNLDDVNLMAISRKSGVSYTVLRAIRSGAQINPTIGTLTAIHDAIHKERL